MADIFDQLEVEVDKPSQTAGDIFDQVDTSPNVDQQPSGMSARESLETLGRSVKPPSLAETLVPGYGAVSGGFDALGRIREGLRGGIVAIGKGRDISDAVVKGLSGEAYGGESILSAISGIPEENIAAMEKNAAEIQHKIYEPLGPKLGGFAENVATVGGLSTPTNFADLLVDPSGLILGPAIKSVGKAAKPIQGLMRGAEAVAPGAFSQIPIRGAFNLEAAAAEPIESALSAAQRNAAIARGVEAGIVPNPVEGRIIPSPVPPVAGPSVPLVTPNPEDIAKFGGATPVGQRIPNIPADSTKLITPIPDELQGMAERLRQIGLPALPEKTAPRKTSELIKIIFNERGSIGPVSPEESKLIREAKDELYDRARRVALATGDSVENILKMSQSNPERFRYILDSVNAPLNAPPAPRQLNTTINSASSPQIPIVSQQFAENKASALPETIQEKNRSAWEEAQKYAAAKVEELQNTVAPGEIGQYPKFQDFARDKYLGELDSAEIPRGVTPSPNPVLSKRSVFNRIEKDTGIETGGWQQRLVHQGYAREHLENQLKKTVVDLSPHKALAKSGLKQDQVFDLMHYVRSQPDEAGNLVAKWDPTALTEGGTKIPAYTGTPPTKEQFEQLAKIRGQFDKMYQMVSDIQPDVGYRSAYVPYSSRFPKTTSYTSASADMPSMMQKRIVDSFSDDLTKDVGKLTQRYARQLATATTMREPIKEAQKLSMQLRFRGMNDAANEVETVLARTLGFKDPKVSRQIFAEDVAKMTEKELEAFKQSLGLEPTLIQDIAKEAKHTVYSALVGLNPANILAQSMQAELGGASEVGLGVTLQRGRSLFSKEAKALLKEVEPRLRGPHINYEEAAPKDTARKAVRAISNVINLPAKPGMAIQDAVDMANRRAVFLQAYKNYMKNPTKALADLTESEAQIIRDAAKASPKKAAIEHGLIRVDRTQHIFSPANTPEYLSSWLGKQVFFSTYSRSEAERLLVDIQRVKNNPAARKALVKKLVAPIPFAIALGKLSGKDSEYFYPPAAFKGALSPTIAPYVTAPAEAYRQRGVGAAVKSAAKLTPPGKLLIPTGRKGGGAKRRMRTSRGSSDR